jgi:hypothetical protein
MGRYPNRGPNGKALGPLWVVFSSLGSETSAPTVLVAINQAKDLSYVFGAPDPRLQPHEGKLVTVEGPISSGLLDLFRSVRPKVIRDAPADVQAKTSGLGSIVRPGPWWDHVSWAYTKVWDLERQHTNLLTVEAARKKFGSRVAVPTSPLAGRMLGIFVWREAGGTQPALQAIFDTNLEYGVSLAPAEPQYDKNWLWGRNRAKGPGWQRRPPYLELVRIASRPGAIEYLRSPEDSRTPAWGLGWRDGQWDCSLDCRLSPTSAPAAADLLEIARSAYR